MEHIKPTNLTANQLLTKEDLQEFKKNMISEIKEIISKQPNQQQWLRSSEVQKLLNISHRTLQTLRINETLSHTRVGKTIYYSYTDLEKLLQKNKQHSKFK